MRSASSIQRARRGGAVAGPRLTGLAGLLGDDDHGVAGVLGGAAAATAAAPATGAAGRLLVVVLDLLGDRAEFEQLDLAELVVPLGLEVLLHAVLLASGGHHRLFEHLDQGVPRDVLLAGDRFEVLWWRRDTWGPAGPFGAVFPLDDAFASIAAEPAFWIRA